MKIAPTVQAWLNSKPVSTTPMAAELRALIAVARAAKDLLAECATYSTDEWDGIRHALARLEKVSKGGGK